MTHVEKNRKYLFFCFLQADKRFVNDVYLALRKLQIKTNKPQKFLSPSRPYSKGRSLEEWRIYIGSKKTLKDLLRKIKFAHPLKQIRSALILKKINGPGRTRTSDLGVAQAISPRQGDIITTRPQARKRKENLV